MITITPHGQSIRLLSTYCSLAHLPYNSVRNCMTALARSDARNIENPALESVVMNALVDLKVTSQAYPGFLPFTDARAHDVYLGLLADSTADIFARFTTLTLDHNEAEQVAQEQTGIAYVLQEYAGIGKRDLLPNEEITPTVLRDMIDAVLDVLSPQLHAQEQQYTRQVQNGKWNRYRFTIPDFYVPGPHMVHTTC